MSIVPELDLVINVAGFSAILWLTAASIIRWFRRGRIESYSVDALLPKGLPSWVRWLLAPTFVVTPSPPSTPELRSVWGITPLGWICFGSLAVWLLVKVV